MGLNIERKILDKDKLIHLTYKEYSGKNVQNVDRATIFLTGWSMKGNSRSLRHIGRELQKSAPDEKIFTIACRSLRTNERIRYEAHAVKDFVKNQGIKELTLIGYSEGATKAISTSALIEEDKDLRLRGLILSSPLGLSWIPNIVIRLINAMAFAIPINTLSQIRKNPKEWRAFFYAYSAGMAVFRGILGEVLKQGIHYLPNLKNDVDEISEKNKDIYKITSPVLIIAGAKDSVVKKREIIGDINLDAKMGIPIKVLGAEKFSSHGLPFLRPRTFIRASLGELERIRQA